MLRFRSFPRFLVAFITLVALQLLFYISPSHAKLATFDATTGPPSSSEIADAMVDRFFSEEAREELEKDSTSAVKGTLEYVDGSGTYIGTDEVHRYESGVKCWSDYFVVQQGTTYAAWTKASGNIYCTDTSVCSISHMDGHQTCETWSIEVSEGISGEIISFGVKSGYQTCNTGTDVSQCSWSDHACHCIWTQQQMTYQNGYKRRRCSSKNGDYTAWIQDFVHDAPTSRVSYGCGSKCTDTQH